MRGMRLLGVLTIQILAELLPLSHAFTLSPLNSMGSRPYAVLHPSTNSWNRARIRGPSNHVKRHQSGSINKIICQAQDRTTPGVSAAQYAWFFGALPALSAFFPVLTTAAQTASVPEDRRFLIILLLILKRVYLYSIALSIVDVAARRSVSSPPGLGMFAFLQCSSCFVQYRIIRAPIFPAFPSFGAYTLSWFGLEDDPYLHFFVSACMHQVRSLYVCVSDHVI
jgi:hypothetical protein